MSYVKISNTDKQKQIHFLILFLMTIISGLVLYRSAIMSTIHAVLHREGSSHGVFVPFLSGYFFWMKREAIWNIKTRYDYSGIMLLVAGLFLGIADIGEYHLKFIGFIVFISGLIALFLGRDFFKETAFPLFFLITMVPLPAETHLALADFVRNITLEGAIRIISIIGIPYFRGGITVQLPNALLKVDLSCSGIRYLFSFFVFGTAYVYLYRKSNLSRLFIIALIFPISIAASISRLTSIFLLTYLFGPKMAEYWPHVFISWTVFFIVLILCLASDQFFLARKQEAKAAEI